MKEIFIDGEYEYDYELIDNIHTLYYNNSENWDINVRNTIALQIIDNGNNLIFSKKLKKVKYDKSLYLTILLKLINIDYKFEISDKTIF
jgi:hypothetical protein